MGRKLNAIAFVGLKERMALSCQGTMCRIVWTIFAEPNWIIWK
jgi:hypothetical protein